MTATFIPRTVFPRLDSLTKSYFLGHHRAGLTKMNSMLSQIDLIIECRDYRVPLTSRNPLFEHSLAGRERLVVYTKRDLGSKGKPEDVQVSLEFIISLSFHYYIGLTVMLYREKTLSASGTIHPRSSSPTTKTAATSEKSSTSQRTTRKTAPH